MLAQAKVHACKKAMSDNYQKQCGLSVSAGFAVAASSKDKQLSCCLQVFLIAGSPSTAVANWGQKPNIAAKGLEIVTVHCIAQYA